MCSSMKQPKPERLVEILGMPITVHSAVGRRENVPLGFPSLQDLKLKSQFKKSQWRPLLAPLPSEDTGLMKAGAQKTRLCIRLLIVPIF